MKVVPEKAVAEAYAGPVNLPPEFFEKAYLSAHFTSVKSIFALLLAVIPVQVAGVTLAL